LRSIAQSRTEPASRVERPRRSIPEPRDELPPPHPRSSRAEPTADQSTWEPAITKLGRVFTAALGAHHQDCRVPRAPGPLVSPPEARSRVLTPLARGQRDVTGCVSGLSLP
jgi:hypothetical protein